MEEAKVKVIEETIVPGEEVPRPLWERWGWQSQKVSPSCTVLQGVYRTACGPVPGRIEIHRLEEQTLRFFIWNPQQKKFRSQCIRATSVEQGILTLQAVLAPVAARIKIRRGEEAS